MAAGVQLLARQVRAVVHQEEGDDDDGQKQRRPGASVVQLSGGLTRKYLD